MTIAERIDQSGSQSAPGFGLGRQREELAIRGMNCASCVRRVEKALGAGPGGRAARVKLVRGRATIDRLVGSSDAADALIEAVGAAGYEATPLPPAKRVAETGTGPAVEAISHRHPALGEASDEVAALRRDAALAFVLTLP